MTNAINTEEEIYLAYRKARSENRFSKKFIVYVGYNQWEVLYENAFNPKKCKVMTNIANYRGDPREVRFMGFEVVRVDKADHFAIYCLDPELKPLELSAEIVPTEFHYE